MDYLKTSTSVSASTYSSEYNQSNTSSNSNDVSAATLPRQSNVRGTLRRLKKHKRFATTTGVIYRTQSILGFPKAAEGSDAVVENTVGLDGATSEVDISLKPNRSTYFSPELDQSKRHQKRYQSFLTKKK